MAGGSGPQVLLGTCSWTDPTLAACGRFYPNTRAKGLMARSSAVTPLYGFHSSAPSRSATTNPTSTVPKSIPSPANSSSSAAASLPSSSSPSSPSSGEKRLWYYSRRLACVEVDASNYAIPAPHLCEAWAAAVPPGFVFNVKAFCLFTAKQVATAASLPVSVRAKLSPNLQQKNPLELDDLSPALRMELWDCLNSSLSVFHRADKLGAVLFQFPLGFTDTPQNRDYVMSCRRMLRSDFTMAVEFRCASWLAQGSGVDEGSLIPAANCTPGAVLPSYVKEDVIEWLRRNGMVFVIVDEFLEEWPDDGTSSSSNKNAPSIPRGRGPPPTFMSSHSLISSSSSSSSSPPSAATLPSSTSSSISVVSPIAALGFQLSSRLLKDQRKMDQRHEHEDEDEDNDHSNGRPRTPPDSRASTAAATAEFANTPPRRRLSGAPSGRARQQTTGAQAAPLAAAARTEDMRKQGGAPVERKVRMVPIVERVTSPSVCYVRIHRRRGTDKLLTPPELDAWALRIRRLARLLKGGGKIYVMLNTNYEDQGIQNAANLARRLPDLVPDWKAMQEEDAQQAKRHFMSLLFAGAGSANKTKKGDGDDIDDDGDNDNNGDGAKAKAREEEIADGKKEKEKEEEMDVQIVGHGQRAKEQKKIDDLFQPGSPTRKRKRDEDEDDKTRPTSDNKNASTGTPTKKTKTKTKERGGKKNATALRGKDQPSLQTFLSKPTGQ